jgi:hypothetical protein
MLTLVEEYNQWLENYESLLISLRWAFRNKNTAQIEDINTRILNTQVQIAICARQLKKEGYPYPPDTVGSTVGGHVSVPDYASMDFDSVDDVPPDWIG